VTAASTPRRRTQTERRSESEEALLAAAAELVAERGIDGASLASIGARAGTSRGLPTHHFGSKDALVARLARRAQDRIYEATVAAVERESPDPDDVPGLELVRTQVDTYLEHFEHPTPEEHALIVMWGATFPAESSVSGMHEAERRSFRGWGGLIEYGQEDGSIRDDIDPTTAAVLLQGILRGVAAMLLTDGAIVEMSRVREACGKVVTAGLAPVDGSTAPPQDGRARRRRLRRA
jgi:AcrR family transcriptional regulator